MHEKQCFQAVSKIPCLGNCLLLYYSQSNDYSYFFIQNKLYYYLQNNIINKQYIKFYSSFNLHVHVQHPNKIDSITLLPTNKNNAIKLQKPFLHLVYMLNNRVYLNVLCFRILVSCSIFLPYCCWYQSISLCDSCDSTCADKPFGTRQYNFKA